MLGPLRRIFNFVNIHFVHVTLQNGYRHLIESVAVMFKNKPLLSQESWEIIISTDANAPSRESIDFLSRPSITFCRFTSTPSSAEHAVIEGQTHHGLLVAAVLPLDFAGLHAPQAGQIV